jgi:uncharacterized protein (UPF0332 family)
MDPQDFMKVAEVLQRHPHEASLRTSIGRAYYGLFNVLREQLEARGIVFHGSPDDHKLLANYFLTNNTIRNVYRIGAALRDLRAARNDADYVMKATVNQQLAQFLYQKAFNALEDFKRLSADELKSALEHMQALN